jgi:hypothetical protein
LLLGKDNAESTTRLSAEEWGNSGTLQKGWECAKQKLLTEEINILVLGTDNSGRNACHWTAEKGKSEILQEIWLWSKEE